MPQVLTSLLWEHLDWRVCQLKWVSLEGRYVPEVFNTGVVLTPKNEGIGDLPGGSLLSGCSRYRDTKREAYN